MYSYLLDRCAALDPFFCVSRVTADGGHFISYHFFLDANGFKLLRSGSGGVRRRSATEIAARPARGEGWAMFSRAWNSD